MEKEDPSNFEFVVPEKLKELYKSKGLWTIWCGWKTECLLYLQQ